MNSILLRKSLRDLRKAMAQSLSLIVISLLGVTSFIALTGAYRDLGTSYTRAYDQLRFADMTIQVTGAPVSVIDQIDRIAGVQAATGRLVIEGGLSLPAKTAGEPPTLVRARLIGILRGQHPAVNDVLVEQGRYLSSSDRDGVLIESHFADIYDLKPGDRLAPLVNGKPLNLTATGIIASPEYLIVSASRQDALPSARTFAVLFVPLDTLQQASGQPGTINDIALRFGHGVDQAAVMRQVTDLLAPYQIASITSRAEQPSNAALHLDLDGYREISLLMPGLILLVAAASLYVMFGRQIRAQQAQIGLMKALGYRTRVVEGHYLITAVIIGLAGALLGIVAGIPLERALTSAYASELGIPLVQTHIYPGLLALGVVLSLLAALLGAFGPARQVARLEPARAMRPSPSEAVPGHTGCFGRLARWPVWLRMSFRNVIRGRRRTLTTALGVVFAFTLILMGWSLVDSMRTVTDRHFNTVERWDEVATFGSLKSSETRQQIDGIAGLQQLEPFLRFPTTIANGAHQAQIDLTALPPAPSLHDLRVVSGDAQAPLAPGKIVLTSALARSLHVSPGDTVRVTNQTGTHQLQVSATVDELMSSVAYVPLADARSWAGEPDAFNGVYAQVDTGQAKQVQAALYNVPGVAAVQLKSIQQSDWQSLMGLFYTIIGAIVLFAVVMAFALLFNTMTVNVLEREREFATMRALGTGRRTIGLLLSTESVILWVLATIPGWLLGYWVARQMGNAFQSDLFAFPVVVNPLTYLITALAVLLTMLLAALPALRRVTHLNLAEATRMVG
jgi:putative ABC transport system permease protein